MSISLFDPAAYRDLRRPLLEASTLPPGCYTSPEFFARERDGLFPAHWQFAGREEQLARAGDYLCHDAPGGPVILLRDRNGAIRAFFNSCRHRGARLLSGSGRCQRIVCPYHSWCYALDGRLVATPGMEEVEGFDPVDYPLVELTVECWAGFLFYHCQPDPPPLAEHLGNFVDYFASHRGDDLQFVGELEFDIESNWKLLAENALEAYHTGAVHRDTLGQQASRPIDCRGNWTGLLVEDEQSVATMQGKDKPFPHIDGLDARARGGAFFTLVYPSTQFVFAQDCAWWLAFQPLAVDRTRLVIGACFPRATVALPEFEQRVELYFDRWRRATAEDNAICEQQQLGQRVERAPGRFAASEFAVHAFDNWVIDQVLAQGRL